jgi:mono/diheme cytochrome c family protein
VINGSLARDELPDVRDIFSGDALASMSIRPKPGLDGRGIVIHMCSQCHNARLDQTLSRARFNAMDLDAMSRAEKDEAIVRLELPDDAPGKMPPPRFRTLSPEELALVVEELAK